MSTVEGTRVPPATYDDLPPAAKAAHDAHTRVARITNMKRTLLHSVPAFEALMTWYPLRDTVQPFLGERLHHAVRPRDLRETDCLICSTFFRRMLIDPARTPTRWCSTSGSRRWSRSGGSSPPTPTPCRTSCTAARGAASSREQIVALTAFGGADGRHQRLQQRAAGDPRRVSRAVPRERGTSWVSCSGQVAFITGAAHGQGRASALALAREGAAVAGLRRRAAARLPRLRHGHAADLERLRRRVHGRRRRLPDLRRRRARRRGDPRRGGRDASSASAGSTSCSTTPASAATAWPTS